MMLGTHVVSAEDGYLQRPRINREHHREHHQEPSPHADLPKIVIRARPNTPRKCKGSRRELSIIPRTQLLVGENGPYKFYRIDKSVSR